MNNKERYEGRVVGIYAPNGGKLMDVISVEEVDGDDLDVLCGQSHLDSSKTYYYLADDIKVEFMDEL